MAPSGFRLAQQRLEPPALDDDRRGQGSQQPLTEHEMRRRSTHPVLARHLDANQSSTTWCNVAAAETPSGTTWSTPESTNENGAPSETANAPSVAI